MIPLLFSCFIATCAVAMTLSTQHLLQTPPDIPLNVLIFLATFFIYTLDRLHTAPEDAQPTAPRLQGFVRHKKPLTILLILSGLGTLISAAFQRQEVMAALIPLALISVTYSISAPRLPRLKNIPYAKTFIVAAVWTLVTAWLPAWRPNHAITLELHAHLAARFAFMFAITLPFDFRDRARDLSAHIRTLPQRLGLNGTRVLAVAALAGFLALSTVAAPAMLLTHILTATTTAALIAAMNPERGDLYYALGVDGTMMLQYALLLTFST